MTRQRWLSGFTLIELLVVIAIIAILSALLAPAVRGLLGVTGPRGGVNTMSAALEQARLAAMESGVPAYAGLAVDTNGGHSAVIVFREPREDETNRLIPVTRWIKMPQSVYHKATDLPSFPVPTGAALPKLGINTITTVPQVVSFDRFGRLRQTTTPQVIELGAKADKDGAYLGGPNNYFELIVQPLTGRTAIVDRAMEGS